MVITYDRTTGQAAFSLINGSATLGATGWNLAANGINAGQGSVTVDTVQMSAEPLSLQVQVSGLTLDPTAGASFEEAQGALSARSGRRWQDRRRLRAGDQQHQRGLHRDDNDIAADRHCRSALRAEQRRSM